MFFLLYRVYKAQNRPDEALLQCEKSLQLLKDCGQPEKMTRVYRDMAAIEHDRGHLDRAIEHLSKARGNIPHTHYKTFIYQICNIRVSKDGARLCC